MLYPQIEQLMVSAYVIPTDYPESDGTLRWESTTCVLVEIQGGGQTGIGYTYADASVAGLINNTLKKVVLGADCLNILDVNQRMWTLLRNNGHSGLTAMGISAVDSALWDLKGKLLGLPVASLLGTVRKGIPIYGSGGFTSYPIQRLQTQLSDWVDQGVRQVKMKVGREPDRDLRRVEMARIAIGESAILFVDANGAYDVKQALEKASQFSDAGVKWFEEPVPSHNLQGLRFIREHAPVDMDIAAGEYGSNIDYFFRMLRASAVDILQADATRCGGISGFLRAGYLCEANQLPYSSHCAPALHLSAAISLASFRIAEYFYDHVRIEDIFFDGLPRPIEGVLYPDFERPGLGLELKRPDIKKYQLH
jgi:L-alanine-DL-glutamate epimerase-like enolase superfamily enzyme